MPRILCCCMWAFLLAGICHRENQLSSFGVRLWAIPLAKGRQSPPWEMKGPRRSAKVYTCWVLTVPSVKSKDLALLFILGKDKKGCKVWRQLIRGQRSHIVVREQMWSLESCAGSVWQFSSITVTTTLTLVSTPRITAWIFCCFLSFHMNHIVWVRFVLVD